jgi:hypothetical protein
MDDVFVWVGAAIGLVITIFYLIKFWSALGPKDVVAGISIMGSSIGLATGVKVCSYAIVYAHVPPIKDISTPAFAGGFGICLYCLYVIRQRFKE